MIRALVDLNWARVFGHIDYSIGRRIYATSNEELTAMRVGIDVRWKSSWRKGVEGRRAVQPRDPRTQIPSVVSLQFAAVDALDCRRRCLV